MSKEQIKKFAKGTKSNLQNQIKKGVIFTRVSTKEQSEGNNHSLEWQMTHCSSYAKKNGIEVVKCFGGTYESAKTEDGKQFKLLMDFLKKSRDVSHVIVYNFDRFSRAGNLSTLDQLRARGIFVMSTTQNSDYTTASGNMMVDFQMMMGKWDNQTRRQKSIDGMREKLKRGEWMGLVPKGYKYDRTDPSKGQKIILSEISKLIRLAFDLKLQRISHPEIVKRLLPRGLRIPIQTLTDLFRNPFYCGFVTHNFLEGEVVKGKHPAIITEEEFLLVNNLLTKGGYENKKVVDDLPLKSLLFCAQCGTPLTGYIVKKKGLYYYKCNHPGCKCNISAKSIHELFAKHLSFVQIENKNIEPLKQSVIQFLHDKSADNIVAADQIKNGISELEKKIETVEEKYAMGDTAQNVYDRVIKKLTIEKKKFEGELENCEIDLSNSDLIVDKCIALAVKLPSAWRSSDYDRKQKLQKALFPDGIRYDRKNNIYRTARMNEVFELIHCISNELDAKENGTFDFYLEKSRSVPGTGVEPARTFGPQDFKSGVSTNSTTQALPADALTSTTCSLEEH